MSLERENCADHFIKRNRKPFSQSRSGAGDEARIYDSHVGNADAASPTSNNNNNLRHETPWLSPQLAPDLARVLDAWPTLPEPIRRTNLALVESAS